MSRDAPSFVAEQHENERDNMTANPAVSTLGSSRRSKEEDDSTDQLPPSKKGPDEPPPPDERDTTQDVEMNQNPAQSSIPDLPAETSKSSANLTLKSSSNLTVRTLGKEEDHSEANQDDGQIQATDQSSAPRYSLRGGKRYPSVEEKMRVCQESWLQAMEEDSSDTTQDEEMCQAPAHPSVPVSNRPSQFKGSRSVRQGKSERAKEHANSNIVPPDKSQSTRLSWRKLEQQVDCSDQPSAPKNGSDEPLPLDEVDMTKDDKMSQTSAQWDLNNAGLVG